MAKVYVISLITTALAVLSFYGADAIKCHVTGGSDVDNCAYCSKTVTSAASLVSAAVYTCEQSCTATNIGSSGTGISRYCCNTNLCNGASSVRTNIFSAVTLAGLAALWLIKG